MPHWVKARDYATRFDAELAHARLESADIPSTIQAHGADGIFGPGFQGLVPGGVTLLVPDDRLADVQEILDDDPGASA